MSDKKQAPPREWNLMFQHKREAVGGTMLPICSGVMSNTDEGEQVLVIEKSAYDELLRQAKSLRFVLLHHEKLTLGELNTLVAEFDAWLEGLK